MNNMQITSAQYMVDMEGTNTIIRATIDGQELFVPLDPANRHYAEIMRQVEAGTLTIAEAD
jgi:Ethanolamine utilization protein EutJ (predicted chaperonin)